MSLVRGSKPLLSFQDICSKWVMLWTTLHCPRGPGTCGLQPCCRDLLSFGGYWWLDSRFRRRQGSPRGRPAGSFGCGMSLRQTKPVRRTVVTGKSRKQPPVVFTRLAHAHLGRHTLPPGGRVVSVEGGRGSGESLVVTWDYFMLCSSVGDKQSRRIRSEYGSEPFDLDYIVLVSELLINIVSCWNGESLRPTNPSCCGSGEPLRPTNPSSVWCGEPLRPTNPSYLWSGEPLRPTNPRYYWNGCCQTNFNWIFLELIEAVILGI